MKCESALFVFFNFFFQPLLHGYFPKDYANIETVNGIDIGSLMVIRMPNKYVCIIFAPDLIPYPSN